MQTAKEILNIIKERSLNVQEIAKNSGISAARIYKWLDGKGSPKVDDSDKLLKWAKNKFEKVPPAQPIQEKGYPPPAKQSPSQTNWDDLISELRENNKFLREMAVANLRGLERGHLYLEAHLRAGLHQAVEIRSQGDEKLKAVLTAEVNKDVAAQYETLKKRGTVPDS